MIKLLVKMTNFVFSSQKALRLSQSLSFPHKWQDTLMLFLGRQTGGWPTPPRSRSPPARRACTPACTSRAVGWPGETLLVLILHHLNILQHAVPHEWVGVGLLGHGRFGPDGSFDVLRTSVGWQETEEGENHFHKTTAWCAWGTFSEDEVCELVDLWIFIELSFQVSWHLHEGGGGLENQLAWVKSSGRKYGECSLEKHLTKRKTRDRVRGRLNFTRVCRAYK